MSFPQAIACEPRAKHPFAPRVRGLCQMSMSGQAAATSPKYVSAEVIAREYDVPVSQVHRGAREGWLPVMKFGRYSRFDPQKVKVALEGREDA